MKSFTVAISIAALALPLCAADQPMPNTVKTVLAQPLATSGQDSPLVRAAKATGRLGKKPGFVITNDTLVRTGGHMTTTTISNPLPPPPAKPDTASVLAEAAMRAKAETDARTKHDTAAKKERQLRNAAADFYGESIEERIDDPAMQEHIMNQMTSTQPPTAAPSKPPQQ